MTTIPSLPAATMISAADAFIISQAGITKQIPYSLLNQNTTTFATRAALVTWATGATFAIGTIAAAVGIAYRYIGTGTVIIDLPGWVIDREWLGTINTPTTLAGYGITDALGANSPALTGTPTAPTAAPGTSTTQLATTAFVATSFAPKASPALTGTPTAPTATPGDSTTTIATTAFATGAIATAVTPLAPKANPVFTGTQTIITATPGDNTTQAASTAFVTAAVAANAGMTLLGTLTTTSGATQTLSGLVLTTYKQLLFEFIGVSASLSSNLTIGSPGILLSAAATDSVVGFATVSLTSGMVSAGMAKSLANAPSMIVTSTGYSTATTSVSVGTSAGTFDAGSVLVYGVK